jgi:cytosine/adenosine deaminase-related metal-dependent hydrolase
MLGEARQALLLHRVKGQPDSTNVDMVLDMATRGGAKVLGRNDIGQITIGKAADLALFNIEKLPYAGCVHDPIASLLFCGASHIADYVIVNGKVVVDKGKLVFAEEDEIVEKVNEFAMAMINKS